MRAPHPAWTWIAAAFALTACGSDDDAKTGGACACARGGADSAPLRPRRRPPPEQLLTAWARNYVPTTELYVSPTGTTPARPTPTARPAVPTTARTSPSSTTCS
ncbi:MAG: hypothetical protein ACXWUL_00970 [Caldimonas sp.]